MNRLDDFGTIEAGKVADLLILEADPLTDIRNMRRLATVVRAGAAHAKRDLEYR
jgi:imidazolonepropionase-like amidohydrolase